MFENNILTGSTGEFGNIVKIYTLLIFTKENIDRAIEDLDDILTKIQKKVIS